MHAQLCTTPAAVICPKALPFKSAACTMDCDHVLNIGMFFDGTGNNRKIDLPSNRQSNVARLYDAYREDVDSGFFRYYIEGVGTPCELTNDDGESLFGGSAGGGGKARIILGLLHVLNTVHFFVNNKRQMFDDPQIKALCSDEHVAPQESNATVAGSGNVEHKRLLREFGLSASLVECGEAERNKFLTKQADLISEKLAARETRPIVVSIYLDVFGFSRGAAQARVFVNWLNRLAMHGQARLFGLPSFIRLLGLFDTVASVGFSDVVGGDGHWGWASTADLRIPPSPVVQNCVHYVALHERRLSFPLDSVCRHDSLPSNCHELICPGAHSDLGGGYLPGEQGKGVFTPAGRPEGNPAARLSQHYLNAMYAAALRTCVAHGPESSPWLKKGQKQNDGRDMEEQFACAPHVPNMVEKYFAQCGISAALPVETAVQEHGMLYLAWRYQITQAQGFENLASVHYAKDTDPTGLHAYRQGQEVLAAQLERMKFDLLKWLRNAKPSGSDHPAVGQIFVRLPKVQVPAEVGWFYDHLVHDSSASFLGMLKDNMTTFLLIESQRYLRYRTVYKGDGHGRNAQPLTNYDPNTGAALPARKKLA